MSYCSWDQVRRQVRNTRASIQAQAPPSALSTIRDFRFDELHNRLFFLANEIVNPTTPGIGQMRLYAVDLGNVKSAPSMIDQPALPWIAVFSDLATDPELRNRSSYWDAGPPNPFRIHGIHSYQIAGTKVLLCSSGTALLGELDQAHTPASPTLRQYPPMNTDNHNSHNKKPQQDQSVRYDLKFGGQRGNYIAFIRSRDIWVADFYGNESQLTFCVDNGEDPTLMSGAVEFVMQEEFHRFSAYSWAPLTGSKLERILYLETSEKDVGICYIPKSTGLPLTSMTPAMREGEMEQFRYPRAGSQNAKSDICIVEFNSYVFRSPESIIRVKRMRHSYLKEIFPWMEYIVRFGWMPDGDSVWIQLLSRLQKRIALVRIPLCYFQEDNEHATTPLESATDPIEVMLEEHNNHWINISDIFHFIEYPKFKRHSRTTSQRIGEPTEFIWSSEKTGYRHLYLVKVYQSDDRSSMQPITSGDWCVLDRPITVDNERKLVYFMGKKETPMESHLYVASFAQEHLSENGTTIRRLTELGFSHNVVMDKSCQRFVDTYSNIQCASVNVIRYIEHNRTEPLPTVKLGAYSLQLSPASSEESEETISGANDYLKQYHDSPFVESAIPGPNLGECHARISSQDSISCDFEPLSPVVAGELPVGQIFNFVNSDGVVIYGCLYKPRNYIPGTRYPTLLSIYGGPKSQLVTNDYKFPRLMRQFMAVEFGFAVVIVDGRGSSDRGLEFEAHIYRRMGTVELQDQIEALDYVMREKIGAEPSSSGELVSIVDSDRVAINGWSYGGYLSLMGLAQYPDKFKLAIAGAPVTRWELYDSAYTERYLGHAHSNPEVYNQGSVLRRVRNFPDSPNRLLIVHGLIDENVHFQNSEELVTALKEHDKPHQFQVYPSERHGLRHASVNEHYETLMFFWLVNYL
ncbi:hypothetical protein INT43_002540 [Umbelopsis isabellina]|uniref:Uncharacterized protein n=1 Tax=Mortierella isabellina TaxID=91625 RepID=A0A8H7Q4S2_MORIS|nr:hypothetical protein INT43_002540 [Umbelopsis isabellina]